MLKTDGRKVVQIYTSEELFDNFNNAVPEGERSDTIRGMLLLYIQNGSFKKQVDSFVSTHKTL